MDFLTSLDHKLFFAVHDLQKFNLDFLLAWPTVFGSLWTVLPIFLIAVLIKSRKKWVTRSLAIVFPFVFAHIGVELMKAFIGRPRPFSFFTETTQAVKVLLGEPHNFSMPSGHASTAFVTAVILTSFFGVPRSLAYALAFLICLTRLYVGVHFPSDLIAGAFWGFCVATLWIRFLKARGFSWQDQAR